MRIKLKDITPIDRYIYRLAQDLSQPFSPKELLEKVQIEHPEWKMDMIKYRCKKYIKQKMLKRTSYFRNTRYSCLLVILAIFSNSLPNVAFSVSPDTLPSATSADS